MRFLHAAGLALSLGVFASPARTQQDDKLQAFTRQMDQARDHSEWAAMERACRDGIAAGCKSEYLLRGLSWSLCRQQQYAEAFTVAAENWRINPCAWSLAQYVEAAAGKGDYDEARKAARFLLNNRAEWSDAAQAAQTWIDAVSSRTYRFAWTIDPAKECFQKQNAPDIRVPLPWTNTPYQTATWTVTGSKAFRVERLGENECVRVTPDGLQPFQLKAQVTLTPCNLRRKVEQAPESKYPADVTKYLGKIGGTDPNSERVQATAQTLKGKTRKDTIENVLNWCSRSLRFTGTLKQYNGGTGDDILERGGGHCEGLTTGAVSLLRACGIPARYIRGHGAVVGDKGHGSWHTIVEYYVTGVGWISWDHGYAPFVTRPTYLCTFHYDAPYDVKDARGDRTTLDLWNFQALGLACEFVSFNLEKSELR